MGRVKTTRLKVREKLYQQHERLNVLYLIFKEMEDLGYNKYEQIWEGVEIAVALTSQLQEVIRAIMDNI